MSVRNLTTDAVKPDQNLQVNSLDANTVNFTDFDTYSFDYSLGTTVTTTTLTGRIQFSNVDDIAIGAHLTVIIENVNVISPNTLVLISSVTSQNHSMADSVNTRKITSAINSINAGQFSVDFLNFSEDTFTVSPKNIIFQYAIIGSQ